MKTSIEKYKSIVSARGSKADTLKGIKKAMLATKPAPNATPIYNRGDKYHYNSKEYKDKQKSLRDNQYLSSKNDYPYAIAQSTWAGGEHSTIWRIGSLPNAVCSTNRVWSRNGKWSGSNTKAIITVTQRAVSILRGNLSIGGLVTLDLEPTDHPREYKAVWAEQWRGYSLKVVHGYIIKGYHVAGDDLAKARKKVAKTRKAKMDAAIQLRMNKNQIRMNKNQIRRDYRGVYVSVADSIAAGNCAPATKSIKKIIDKMLGGDVGAVRADILLSVIDDRYSRRAVYYAARTHHYATNDGGLNRR